ncbi:ExeA family protein [Salinisphaera orenii]|uniref:Peptidoglycan-binding protein n=1 Tax=Salinisphaera orenii YIM 95161 TaxID=1051139 RepID=A0A423PLE7_9GAMM|nr:AAA family ATPase [Salinisphaera halophila]ROO26341.1 peptidoglycan-binding protein [Salinisphaera halophila YIM 95161]
MYLRYYGFKDFPFSVTPDPAFLYLSASHREALGHLLYGAGEHGGFVALIGEVGTGKTTLIRALVDNEMSDLDIALCWNPQLQVKEFVATICDELGADYDPQTDTSQKALVDRLNAHLLATHAANRRTVLIIDEAQNLSREVLEQLRLLTNLETHKHKLLRIILVGQPELSDLLERHDLRQLAQRITARFRLRPLDRHETRAYIQHRLDLAGGSQHLFTRPATALARLYSGGIPRLINMVCERALMGGYANGKSRIGALMLSRAAMETLPRRRRVSRMRVVLPALALALVALLGAAAWYPGVQLSRAAAGWLGADQGKAAQVASAGEASAASNRSSEGGSPETPDAADADDAERADAASDTERDTPPSGIPEGDADINQMLRLWGVFGSQVQSSCDALRVGDLRCLADSGSFAMVERYNRPALLTLQREGRRHTVLLSALDDTHATLVGANGTRRVDRRELAGMWTGDFRIIWRSDSGVGLIQPGAVGDAVVWLRQRLARASGRNPEAELGPPSPVYDDELQAELEAFQLSKGLRGDGMAGPRTQIMLNGAVPSPGSPALNRVEE